MEFELQGISAEDEFGPVEEPSSPSPVSKKPKRKSEKKDKPANRFLCTVAGCNYTTPYKKDLVRHMRKHTGKAERLKCAGEKPYTCELCSKQFSRYDKLMAHTRAHEGLRSFTCTSPSCTYASIDSSGLKRHMARIHSDEKPYECQLCPYRAKDSAQMNIHVRFHTGDSPYSCTTCSRAFKTSTDLQRHERVHTKEKPFWCSHCPFTTSHKCNLTTHIKRKHSQLPHSAQSQPVVPLTSTESSSIPKRKRLVHEKSTKVVNDDKRKTELPFTFACKFCKYETDSVRLLKLHMVKRHKTKNYDAILDQFSQPKKPRHKLLLPSGSALAIPKYRCVAYPDCSVTFVSEKSLRCHMRQHATLHPPPAPTVEIIIPASCNEEIAEPTSGHSEPLLLSSDSEPLKSVPSRPDYYAEEHVIVGYYTDSDSTFKLL